LGTAAAALVAQGLGSDAGIVDLAGTMRFWADQSGVDVTVGSSPSAVS
jgi:hypothetical protein